MTHMMQNITLFENQGYFLLIKINHFLQNFNQTFNIHENFSCQCANVSDETKRVNLEIY